MSAHIPAILAAVVRLAELAVIAYGIRVAQVVIVRYLDRQAEPMFPRRTLREVAIDEARKHGEEQ